MSSVVQESTIMDLNISLEKLGFHFVGPEMKFEESFELALIGTNLQAELPNATTLKGQNCWISRNNTRIILVGENSNPDTGNIHLSVIAIPDPKLVDCIKKAVPSLLGNGPAERVPGAIGTLTATAYRNGNPPIKTPNGRVIAIKALQTHLKEGPNCTRGLITKCLGWRRDAMRSILRYAKENSFSCVLFSSNVALMKQFGSQDKPSGFAVDTIDYARDINLHSAWKEEGLLFSIA